MIYKILLLILVLLLLLFIYTLPYNNHILPNNNSFNPLLNYYNLLEFFNLVDDKNTNTLINYTMKIPTYLKPRNHIPVANEYQIIKNINDYSDFHFILYWINDNEATIIIRKLDNYKILVPFKLKIYDINNDKFEIINFEATESNDIIKNIKTNIKLVKVNIEYNQLIPKIIIQTAKDIDCNLAQYNSIMSFIELNPEYEYMFFDDTACYNYIKNNYNQQVLDAYNNLIPTAYKADLFRNCVLYKIGGCYFDIKQINRVPLREIINKDDDLILCDDIQLKAFYNALIICTPNNITIKKVIDKIILNTQNKFYGNCALCPTGPCLLYNVIPNYKADLSNNFNFLFYYYKIRHKGYIYSKKLKKIICNTAYRNYYKKDNKNYYSNLWNNKNIYVI